jgi:outer membrane lipoprotein LolB
MSVLDYSPTRPERWPRHFAWLLVGLSLLAGCATTRQGIPLPDISTWEARSTVLGNLREWEFVGRIAFKATVGGPLGIGTVRIEGDSRSVVLTDKDGVQTSLRDAETELRYRYGWTIPVTSLRYWALGIPDPSMAAETQFDDGGRLARLRQSEWVVEISRYREGGGQPMPRILSVTNSDTRVRMVIDRWLFFDR